MKVQCYYSVTNAFQLVFWGKVYCEACCGGAKKWDAMIFVLIPTTVLNDIYIYIYIYIYYIYIYTRITNYATCVSG